MGDKSPNLQISKSPNSLHLHIARWVVPVSRPPIENGAIATFEGKIVEVGPASELRSSYLAEIIDYGDSILCPALINTHSHLELSPLRWRLSPSGSFVDWVRSLIEARDLIRPGEWEPAICQAIKEMQQNGTIAVGDVGNLDVIPLFASRKDGAWSLRGVFFKEIICPVADKAKGEIPLSLPFLNERIAELVDILGPSFHYALSAHAPYSVAPLFLKAIKAWDQGHGMPFSIHVAESEEEIEFLQGGQGPIRELMQEKGHWPLNYDLPKASPVKYLEILGLLDRHTVCIHCIHVDREDISILAEKGASVCLCPRSNVFLGVGVSPAEELHASGVPLALGTDSLASNDQLSIFAEMASLSKLVPGLPPEAIFRAGTYGGARALGISGELGSLGKGKDAVFLAVASGSIGSKDVLEFLVHGGDTMDWVMRLPAAKPGSE
jgi:cytosine/adenosine deaminase-related metal-dependent hydrolase